MPDFTGEELIQQIKQINPNIHPILCTGFSTKINEDKAKGPGIDASLMKPLDISELLQIIRRVLYREGEK